MTAIRPVLISRKENSVLKEIWKNVIGYEGYYEVSNLGNVRSLDRWKLDLNGNMVLFAGRIMKQYKGDKYPRIDLQKPGCKRKNLYVHRLVAEAFIPNPHELLEVNHIDEDKTNNKVENLEWCDRKYNNSYGTRLERQLKSFDYESVAEKISKTKKRIKYDGVYQMDLNGNVIKHWPVMKVAAKELGASYYGIVGCCRGVAKTSGGYTWKYANLRFVE